MDSDNKRMLYAATDSHQSTVHQFGPLFYVAAPVTAGQRSYTVRTIGINLFGWKICIGLIPNQS